MKPSDKEDAARIEAVKIIGRANATHLLTAKRSRLNRAEKNLARLNAIKGTKAWNYVPDEVKKDFEFAVNEVEHTIYRQEYRTANITTFCTGVAKEWLGGHAGNAPEVSLYILILQSLLPRGKYLGEQEIREAGPPCMVILTPAEYLAAASPVEGDMVALKVEHVSK